VPISGLAVEIIAQARDGKNRFEIRLDPPELGRIDVHLAVDRDGNVSSRLVVDRSETLDLLRRDAPTLERALENAGLKTAQQGLEFSLRDQGGRHQPYANEAGTTRLIAAEVDPSSAAAISNGYGRWLGMGGGVDIRV
jgi:flagellar hook-length control protein FliK